MIPAFHCMAIASLNRVTGVERGVEGGRAWGRAFLVVVVEEEEEGVVLITNRGPSPPSSLPHSNPTQPKRRLIAARSVFSLPFSVGRRSSSRSRRHLSSFSKKARRASLVVRRPVAGREGGRGRRRSAARIYLLMVTSVRSLPILEGLSLEGGRDGGREGEVECKATG